MNKVIKRQHSTEQMPGAGGGNKMSGEGVSKRKTTGRAFTDKKEKKCFNTGKSCYEGIICQQF